MKEKKCKNCEIKSPLPFYFIFYFVAETDFCTQFAVRAWPLSHTQISASQTVTHLLWMVKKILVSGHREHFENPFQTEMETRRGFLMSRWTASAWTNGTRWTGIRFLFTACCCWMEKSCVELLRNLSFCRNVVTGAGPSLILLWRGGRGMFGMFHLIGSAAPVRAIGVEQQRR